jgi:Ni/Co efflux regulator RcnB
MKRIALIAAILVAGTSLVSAQPGAREQDRGNREQSIGVSDNGRSAQARHTVKRHKVARHRVAHRSARHGTTGRGLPPGGREQQMRQNESDGLRPDGRM